MNYLIISHNKSTYLLINDREIGDAASWRNLSVVSETGRRWVAVPRMSRASERGKIVVDLPSTMVNNGEL
jgi:hypothetical protein